MTRFPGPLDLGTLDGPVLVYGGTYSNLQATEALLAEADRLNIPPERRIHTGDVVAYCADAAAVTDLVMTSGGHVVRGNCEEGFGQDLDGCGCGFEEGSACDLASRDWVAHADRQLSPQHRAFMARCPGEIRFRLGGLSFAATHGGFSAVNRFVFAPDEDAIAEELSLTDVDCVLAGHCGVPFHHRQNGRHWINAGVVGMPFNDGTPETGFVVLSPETDAVRVTFHRLSYDQYGASAAMRHHGLPAGYADALLSGLWPNMDVMPPAQQALCGQPLELPPMLIHPPQFQDRSSALMQAESRYPQHIV